MKSLDFTLKKHNKLYLVGLCLLCFSFYFSLHYYQIYYKNYPLEVGSTSLSLARNLHFTNLWSFEDAKNVYLSSDIIVEKGVISNDIGNKLTPIFYKYVFDIFGFNTNIAIIVCLILWSLSAVLIFLILYKLFGLPIAFLGFAIDSLLPYFWGLSTNAGFYELAVFLFTGGLFFYFFTKGNKILIIAGIFFALAILARNAFVISVFAILFFELYQSRFSKRLFFLALPILIIVGSSFALDYINQSNYYFTENKDSYNLYGHLFPDPYTFHFNQEEYINKIKDTATGDMANFLEMYGEKTSLKQKLFSYYYSFTYYIKNFFRLPILGGPFILFLMILGGYYLYGKNKKLIQLFLFWLVSWFILLFILRTSNYDHFAEIRFIIVTLSAIGFYQLAVLLSDYFKDQKKLTKSINVILVGLLLIQILLVTKYIFGRQYESNNIMVVAYPIIQTINSSNIDVTKDIIAVGFHPSLAGVLNYYTNKNLVYFSEETINDLAPKGKLKEAFAIYQVNKIIGYNSSMTKDIIDATGVEEIK